MEDFVMKHAVAASPALKLNQPCLSARLAAAWNAVPACAGKWMRSGGARKAAMLLAVGLTVAQGLFAQSSGSGQASGLKVAEYVQKILDFLTNPWVKGVCVIALIVECIGMITAGRQEPGMFKKFIPWIAGTVLFMSAGSIVNMFLDLNTASTDIKIK
jgi:type IV secretory pathway VirB2 component (pilin)